MTKRDSYEVAEEGRHNGRQWRHKRLLLSHFTHEGVNDHEQEKWVWSLAFCHPLILRVFFAITAPLSSLLLSLSMPRFFTVSSVLHLHLTAPSPSSSVTRSFTISYISSFTITTPFIDLFLAPSSAISSFLPRQCLVPSRSLLHFFTTSQFLVPSPPSRQSLITTPDWEEVLHCRIFP